ncbi:hypothetical protein B5V01_29170 [Mesorhizobium erdmanii]|uniref:Response regulator n=1 Tax=Mesorhizobium erdmanii TaxID=1777866 RepID=A0A4V1P4A9_9HYPH|nr:hypothetical protein B5V01_29170 [Mesorhizobium erdmanii]
MRQGGSRSSSIGRAKVGSTPPNASYGVLYAARETSGAFAETFLRAPGRTLKAVLTDIRLGDGPNGWEIGRHVRGAAPTMPVIYISGDSAADWHAQGVPGSIMIPKPFAIAQIVTAIASLLNKVSVGLPSTAC